MENEGIHLLLLTLLMHLLVRIFLVNLMFPFAKLGRAKLIKSLNIGVRRVFVPWICIIAFWTGEVTKDFE